VSTGNILDKGGLTIPYVVGNGIAYVNEGARAAGHGIRTAGEFIHYILPNEPADALLFCVNISAGVALGAYHVLGVIKRWKDRNLKSE
jgi:hypothetical protein